LMTVPTVNTEAGRLSGDHTDGVARFLGVPYAAAPAGEGRFAPPGPAERWAGTRNATGYGATAPQPALHPAHAYLAPLIGPGWVIGDGDYLNLNVWTPDHESSLSQEGDFCGVQARWSPVPSSARMPKVWWVRE